jgi:ribonuclease P protein component
MRQTFRKNERLCKKILITNLFIQGKSFTVYPFRVTWQITAIPSDYPAQLLISVPKSLMRKAYARNRIKRRMRESFRKNKQVLYEYLNEKQVKMVFCITYTAKEILPYQLLQEKIIVLLQRLRDDHAKSAG